MPSRVAKYSPPAKLAAFCCATGPLGAVDVQDIRVRVLLRRVVMLVARKLLFHCRAEKAVPEHVAAEAPELCEYVQLQLLLSFRSALKVCLLSTCLPTGSSDPGFLPVVRACVQSHAFCA